MSKITTILASAAVLLTPAFALAADSTANVGTDQLSTISPVPGAISLDVLESGFSSMLLNFKGGAEVDRSANLFITMTRNGNVVANVPASNTMMVKYDSFMDFVWQVVFYMKPGYEAKAGGHYQVTIPEGYFLIGEAKTPNKEIVLNYQMDVNQTSIYPEETKRATELQDFIVTFGAYKSVRLNPECSRTVAIFNIFQKGEDPGVGGDDDEPIVAPDTDLHPDCAVNDNALNLHLAEKVTEAGTWNVEIPESFLILTKEDGSKESSPALAFQYKIPNYTAGVPMISPEAGNTYFFPGELMLTIDKSSALTIVNDRGASFLYAVDSEGNLGDVIATYRAASKKSDYYVDPATGKVIAENANRVFLVNELGRDVRIYPAPGAYQLVTADKLFQTKKDGQISFTSTLYYNFEVPDFDMWHMELTPDPSIPVYGLQEIKVKFPASKVKVTYGPALFKSSTTTFVFYPSVDPEDPETVVFRSAVPVTLPGEYTLTSANNSIEIDEDFVVVNAKYTVSSSSGIEECEGGVTVLPQVFDIYNAQGILMKRNAGVDDLNALPAGIYIAGGKKIVNR